MRLFLILLSVSALALGACGSTSGSDGGGDSGASCSRFRLAARRGGVAAA